VPLRCFGLVSACFRCCSWPVACSITAYLLCHITFASFSRFHRLHRCRTPLAAEGRSTRETCALSLSTDQIVSTSFVASCLAPSPRCHRLLHLAVAAPSPASSEPALRLHPMALLPVSGEEGSMPWPCRRQQICRRRRRKGSHRCSLSAYPFDGFAVARRCPRRQRRPGSQWRRASGPRFLHRLHESRLGGPRRTSCPSSCSMERPSPSQCRSSSKPWWAL
jgi:hypothetical protein